MAQNAKKVRTVKRAKKAKPAARPLRLAASAVSLPAIDGPSPDTLVAIPPANTFNQGLQSASEQTMLNAFGVPGQKTRDCSPVTGAFKSRIVSGVNVGPFNVSGLDIAVASLKRVFAEANQQNSRCRRGGKDGGHAVRPSQAQQPKLILEPQLGQRDRYLLRKRRRATGLEQNAPWVSPARAILQPSRLVLGRGIFRRVSRQHAFRTREGDDPEPAAVVTPSRKKTRTNRTFALHRLTERRVSIERPDAMSVDRRVAASSWMRPPSMTYERWPRRPGWPSTSPHSVGPSSFATWSTPYVGPGMGLCW